MMRLFFSKSITLIFLLCISRNMLAQSEIGMHAGVHKSNFYGKERNNFSQKSTSYWNYTGAIYYKKPISDNVYIGAELENIHVKSNLYFMEWQPGGKYSYVYDVVYNLDYINFHFLLGTKLFSIKQVTVFGSISPYIGYLVHSRANGYEKNIFSFAYSDSLGMHNGSSVQKIAVHDEQAKQIRQLNIGSTLNVEATIPLNNTFFILLHTSYNLGFKDVVNEQAFIGIRGYAFSTGIVYKIKARSSTKETGAKS